MTATTSLRHGCGSSGGSLAVAGAEAGACEVTRSWRQRCSRWARKASQVVTGRQARRERLDRPGAHRSGHAPVVRRRPGRARHRPSRSTVPAVITSHWLTAPRPWPNRDGGPLYRSGPGRWPAVPVATTARHPAWIRTAASLRKSHTLAATTSLSRSPELSQGVTKRQAGQASSTVVAGRQLAGESTSAASRAAHSRVRRPRHQKSTPITMKQSTGISSVHKYLNRSA